MCRFQVYHKKENFEKSNYLPAYSWGQTSQEAWTECLYFNKGESCSYNQCPIRKKEALEKEKLDYMSSLTENLNLIAYLEDKIANYLKENQSLQATIATIQEEIEQFRL